MIKDLYIRYFNTIHGNKALLKPPRRSVIIILMYHHVSDTPANTLFEKGISGELFEDELRCFLKVASPLPPDRLEACLDGHLDPGYYFLPTFDDAFSDTYRVAAPVMKKLGLQGIVFIPTAFIDRSLYPWEHAVRRILSSPPYRLADHAVERRIAEAHNFTESDRRQWLTQFPSIENIGDIFATWEDIRAWKVVLRPASHTVSHLRLDLADKDRIEFEYAESARIIEERTGEIPWAFAPPFGKTSRISIEAAFRFYRIQFGTDVGLNISGKRHNLLKRIGPRPGASDNDYLMPRLSWYYFMERIRG